MDWAATVRASRHATWESAVESYTHWLPARFNIGAAVAHTNDPAYRNSVAIIHVSNDGDSARSWTFGELDRISNRLANALSAKGVRRGDRVAVRLPQSFEAAAAHVAVYKLGAIVVPLFINFGWEAVAGRVHRSGAKVCVVGHEHLDELLAGADEIPAVELVLSVGEGGRDTKPQVESFWDFLNDGSPAFEAVATTPDDPAFLCFTSGTTGPPKGALHGHRVLLGHLAGLSATHDLAPRPGDLFWTPADWGWMGGLFDALLPALYWGLPVVAHRNKKFDAEQTYRMLKRFSVQNAFIPPTALRMMRAAGDPSKDPSMTLKTIASGGEALGAGTLEWAESAFAAHVNEFYGQTECNLILGNCGALFERKPGSMGRPLPGRVTRLADENGNEVPDGTAGELVVAEGDPIMMLGYWDDPDATAKKINGGHLHTGDLAVRDEEGFYFFVGRNDDIISSAGYRIGPTDIENAMNEHPAVSAVAVVGKPDEIRGEVVKAVVVLHEPQRASADPEHLTRELQALVRDQVGGHAYPREVEFVSELPMTSTGKVRRGVLRDAEKAKVAERIG
jgi:acetyl-CoA synthetase